MVLFAHEFFNLLFTALQLVHDLSVSLLDRKAVITLAMAEVLEGFLPVLLGLLVLGKFLLVEKPHLLRPLFLILLRVFQRLLQVNMLFVTVRRQLFAERLVSTSQVFLSQSQVLLVSILRILDLVIMLVELLNDALPLLRLLPAGELFDFLNALLLLLLELVNAI